MNSGSSGGSSGSSSSSSRSTNNAVLRMMAILPHATGNGLRLLLQALNVITQPMKYSTRTMKILEETYDATTATGGTGGSGGSGGSAPPTILTSGIIPTLYRLTSHRSKKSGRQSFREKNKKKTILQILSIRKNQQECTISDGVHFMSVKLPKSTCCYCAATVQSNCILLTHC